MYVYQGHLGTLYTSEYELNYDDLYCEECGDYDWYIGYATTKQEAWNLFAGDIDINGSGGWNYNYIKEFIERNWK